MARTTKKARRWRARIVGALVLVALLAAGWWWWETRNFRPAEDAYPDQGAFVSADSGAVEFPVLHAIGADFVYLLATSGADGEDPAFARDYAAARAAGLQVGVVHVFDPCRLADGQSANFVTTVPRGQAMLPPAIALTKTGEDCDPQVGDAQVESELMTFINQIEMHVGKPVILKVSPEFEDRYTIAARLERQLWLTRDRFAPTYGGRPWLLWSANHALPTQAADEPLEWVVVQP